MFGYKVLHLRYSLRYALSLLLYTHSILAIDNLHFYRASFFWGEPRFEKPWLTTIEIHAAKGYARTGRNARGKRVPLLSLFGFQDIRLLGKTPTLDEHNTLDQLLINLADLPARNNFGFLEFRGKFETTEIVFNAYQNLINGFFIQLYFPIREFKIKQNRLIDRSPDDHIFPNANTAAWVNVLNNFNAILTKFDLSRNPFKEFGCGDLSLLGGWTCNYEETKKADFIDVDAKIGVLFPTGKRKQQRNVFALPTGYDGFWGIPLKFDASLGYWEWVTIGFHIGALFLIEQTRTIRMQPVLNASPFFMLLKGKAKVDPGTFWELAAYLKADHIYSGLSLLFGYAFNQKEAECIKPENTLLFEDSLVNNNPLLHSWNMHVLHFMAEWDFTKQPLGAGFRIGFFYNYTVGGKRIFNTAMKDLYAGLDIAYCF